MELERTWPDASVRTGSGATNMEHWFRFNVSPPELTMPSATREGFWKRSSKMNMAIIESNSLSGVISLEISISRRNIHIPAHESSDRVLSGPIWEHQKGK